MRAAESRDFREGKVAPCVVGRLPDDADVLVVSPAYDVACLGVAYRLREMAAFSFWAMHLARIR